MRKYWFSNSVVFLGSLTVFKTLPQDFSLVLIKYTTAGK
jgi:hypothetical protein